MRKNTKQSLLDIVKTIYDAHDDIKKLLKKGYSDNAASLIGDCQDAALSVGNTIIGSEGEEFITIGLMENYCKDLFEIYNLLNSDADYDCNVIYKTLNKDLTDIKKSIEKDIRVKTEIVFMPYKASMWDSLESVWKAAYEDPDCDAYVVPIPYYDRKADHSFGEFHYEGDQFPDYVPITHYLKYDERKRKPDVIYIHNPYDDHNYVTSVDPRFYSDQLRKCTECLVYIPYFVVDESKSIEKIKHYALAPGVINSDYVIVQSEKVRQKYIDILIPHYGNTTKAKHFLEKKILGFGSPKFDAVKRDKPSIESLPKEWQQIIGDGSKKVIFFNTHLSLLMATNYESFLIKLEQVFEFFKTREDVILLWRPHPLAISTAKSMNPVAVEPYLRIVEKYKDEKWGIYDDTSDMDRAIALADAYYGSESSVVPVFKETGKPVMIMNIRCDNTKNPELLRVSPSAFCIVGDDIYLFHSMMNLLVKYNTVSRSTEIIGQLNDEDIFLGTLISDMFYINGKILMIPCWAKKIHVYDISTGTFSVIKYECNELKSGLFIKSFLIGNRIYCIPFMSDEIIIIDTNMLSVIKRVNIRNQIVRNYEFINKACLIDNNRIGFVTCDPYINIFDIETETVQTIFSGNEHGVLTIVTSYNNFLYVVNKRNNSLVKIDFSDNKIEVIYTASKYFIVYSNNSNIILDFQNKYIVYDTVSNIFSAPFYRKNNDYKTSLSYEYKYSLVSEINDSNYEFDRYSEILYINKNGKITEHFIELLYDDLALFTGDISKETELYGLDDVINNLEKSNINVSDNNESNGRTIHLFIRSRQ